MRSLTSIALLAALILLLAGQPASAQKEEEAADLDSFTVGERRNVIEPKKIEIERPKFEPGFKLEAAKPNLSNFQIARPKLEVLAGPAAPASTSGQSSGAPAANGAGATANQGASNATRSVRPLSMEPPEYPRDALRRRQEGHVVVEFTINAQGTTEDISVVDAEPRGAFENEARRAVSRWTFEPALQDGRPVSQRIRHTLEFTLNGQ